MIVAVPAETPVTTPVPEPTVAIPVAEELHVPPDVPSLSVVVEPAHIAALPVMDAGNAFTVTVVLAVHPELVV